MYKGISKSIKLRRIGRGRNALWNILSMASNGSCAEREKKELQIIILIEYPSIPHFAYYHFSWE